MQRGITNELLTSVQERCAQMIEEVLSAGFEEDDGIRYLKSHKLATALAWQVLVPIITTVVGGIAVEGLKDAVVPEEQVRAFVGEETRSLSEADLERCRTQVMIVLGPFGATETDVARLVDEVAMHIGNVK